MVVISSKISRKRRVIVLVNNAVYSLSVQNSNKSEEKKKEPNLEKILRCIHTIRHLQGRLVRDRKSNV